MEFMLLQILTSLCGCAGEKHTNAPLQLLCSAAQLARLGETAFDENVR